MIDTRHVWASKQWLSYLVK